MKTRSKKIRDIYRVVCIKNNKVQIQDFNTDYEALLIHKCNLGEKLNSQMTHLKVSGRIVIK